MKRLLNGAKGYHRLLIAFALAAVTAHGQTYPRAVPVTYPRALPVNAPNETTESI